LAKSGVNAFFGTHSHIGHIEKKLLDFKTMCPM
jgi:hypothetical protein